MQAGAGAAALAALQMHAALQAHDATALAANLAAVGPPGSPDVLAALNIGRPGGLLVLACHHSFAVLPALLAAFGPAGCAAVAAALAAHDHLVLRLCCYHGSTDALVATLGAYGSPGCAALKRALDQRSVSAIVSNNRFNSPDSHVVAVKALLAAFGPAGCAEVRAALSAGDYHVFYLATAHDKPAGILAALLSALGPPGCSAICAALDDGGILNAVLQAFKPPDWSLQRCNAALGALLDAWGEPQEATAARVGAFIGMFCCGLSFIRPQDSRLARLAVRTPEAWQLGNAARVLLTAPTRTALALPTLLAMRRLPEGVAAPLAAFLRSRPWLLFSSPL